MPGIIALLCLPCLLSLAAARPVEKLNAPTDILGTIPDSKSKLYLHTDVIPPSSCKELLLGGTNESGQYTINLGDNEGEFEVYCDMDTGLFGGGWTVIQRRVPDEPNENYFHRDWKAYTTGFGRFQSSFWLGLEKIKRITALGTYELYIGMEDAFRDQAWAHYSSFKIGDAASKYALSIGTYDGTASDALEDHNGYKFSTFDQDNDSDKSRHCSQIYKGGWWFEKCLDANLNGINYGPGHFFAPKPNGIAWHFWKSEYSAIVKVVMAIRPKDG